MSEKKPSRPSFTLAPTATPVPPDIASPFTKTGAACTVHSRTIAPPEYAASVLLILTTKGRCCKRDRMALTAQPMSTQPKSQPLLTLDKSLSAKELVDTRDNFSAIVWRAPIYG